MKKKIGIMGGTFDPPHTGHLAMAEHVRTVMALDEIWFLPTGGVTYKENSKMSPPKDRLAMTRLAVEGNPYFSVNAMEAESGKACYSYETMETLRKIYPDVAFTFIVGADSLGYMDAWREPGRLLQCCDIAAVNRTGTGWEQMEEKKTLLEEKFRANITLVSMPPVDVSSSWLREQINQGKNVDPYLSDAVSEYIRQHELYRG